MVKAGWRNAYTSVYWANPRALFQEALMAWQCVTSPSPHRLNRLMSRQLLHDTAQLWDSVLMTTQKILGQVFKKQGGESLVSWVGLLLNNTAQSFCLWLLSGYNLLLFVMKGHFRSTARVGLGWDSPLIWVNQSSVWAPWVWGLSYHCFPVAPSARPRTIGSQ